MGWIIWYNMLMRWQDIVISIAQLCFVFALIPSIRSKDKPAASSSIMNIVLLAIINTCLLTLQLWFSAFTGCLVMIAWLVLAIQKINSDKKA
jgi:hypothetical protein